MQPFNLSILTEGKFTQATNRVQSILEFDEQSLSVEAGDCAIPVPDSLRTHELSILPNVEVSVQYSYNL